MDSRFRVSALLVAALAIAVDQATKSWALTALRQAGGHMALYGPLDLTLVFNQSNAFGLTPVLGHTTRWLLMSANLIVAAILLYVVLARDCRPLTRFGLALIFAGAVGNALDRLFIGSVVDFFDAAKIGFVWVFNVADAILDIGIGLIVFSAVLSRRETTNNVLPT